MAYVSQEKKALIAAELKKVIPAGWKTSLSVHNHSTIILTIASAPFDLVGEWKRNVNKKRSQMRQEIIADDINHVDINVYYIDDQFDESLESIKAIYDALNLNNHDRSDPQTDYFDVGHYVDIRIGKFEKPFVCTAA